MFETIYDYFFGSALGMWELIATILLITNVYLLAKQKLINYWFGLAGVLLMGYVLKEINLYSDMLLQWVFYAPLQIVGYVMWKYGRTLGEVATDSLDSMKIVKIGQKGLLYTGLGIALGTPLMGSFMMYFTDAAFPFLDALTTTMSVAASILMLKKIWENWIIWIAVDAISIPLYYHREAYVLSGLYVIFFGLATYGLITWYRDLQNQKAITDEEITELMVVGVK